MASSFKGMLIRSPSDVSAQTLKVKYMAHIGHLRDQNLLHCSRTNEAKHVLFQDSSAEARKFQPLLASHLRLNAVMAPVSDQTSATKKRVFTFGKGRSEGNKGMKSLLGGKGANLAEMASIGLSVPPGLTISTEACQEYQENGKTIPDSLWEEILEGLRIVEKDMGSYLGDPSKPLLLSVRSGAAISMPGMMDTVLNLGLNDDVVAGLAAKSGERFAYDSYRRFLDMFGNVVMGIPHSSFEEKLDKLKQVKAVKLDTELTANDLKELVEQYKNVYLEVKGEKFPAEVQLRLYMVMFDSA